jgi:flagellar motor protein MotB
MDHKKTAFLAVLAVFLLSAPEAEVLTWKANVGKQFNVKVTAKESVTGLNSITEKPETSSDSTINQEDAAQKRSILANVQGLPSFPRGALKPGDTWQENASISLDLANFGIAEPVTLTTPVSYKLVEISEIEGLSYYHITAVWSPIWIPDAKTAKASKIERISGLSSMDLYWDNKAGSPKKADFVEELQYRFTEKSSLLLTRTTKEDFETATDIVREKMIEDLNKQIETQKVANVEVKQTDEGIVLSIENIQFEAESAVLSDTEKKKIDGIGKLLSGLASRKLSIVGHAANIAGSDEKELLTLSAGRAKAVADYLVEAGFRTADSVVSSGMGGSKPLADNATPEGRSKNRRVEIVIMDEETQQ